jgi:hypothetical protein
MSNRQPHAVNSNAALDSQACACAPKLVREASRLRPPRLPSEASRFSRLVRSADSFRSVENATVWTHRRKGFWLVRDTIMQLKGGAGPGEENLACRDPSDMHQTNNVALVNVSAGRRTSFRLRSAASAGLFTSPAAL